MGRKLNFPIERMNPLRFACHRLSGYYNGYCFLVGSQMNPGKENPRDIDIICVIPDAEFERRYGGKLQDWDLKLLAMVVYFLKGGHLICQREVEVLIFSRILL